MKTKSQPIVKHFTKQIIGPTGMIHKIKFMQYVYKADDTKKKKVASKPKKCVKKSKPLKKVMKPKPKVQMG